MQIFVLKIEDRRIKMALRIRLRQVGRKNRLTYRLVVANARWRRDGKYVEMVGHYNPHAEGKGEAHLAEDRISHWLEQGAEMSEKAKSLIKRMAPEVIKIQREKEQAKKLKCLKKRKKK